MFMVYALYNASAGKIYIGQCINLAERLRQHNLHLLPKAYTSRYEGTWILIYSETQPNRPEALEREKQLKSYRGREFIRKYIPR